MKSSHRIVLLAAVAAAALACGNKKPHPSVPPYKPISQIGGFETSVDPEIRRIYGNPPVFGKLPRALTWSPDGSRALFLRTGVGENPDPEVGLWEIEAESARERPLLQDPELPVDEFAWIDADTVIVGSSGDLYLVGLDGERTRLTETEEAEQSVIPSPDGRRVAFVRGFDLFVMELATGEASAVTEDGTEDRYYGGVSWVYGEELSTEAGFGWSPDSKRLWLYSVDEIEVAKRTVIASSQGEPRVQAYPRPGEKNPVLRVGVADVSGGSPKVRWMETGEDPDIYLPLVTWNPDSEKVTVVRLDRLQTILELIECDAKVGSCERVLEERDPRWLNLLGEPVYLEKSRGFLWLSERSGFSHIYLMGEDGVEKKQLTNGEWVVSSIAHVDEEGGWVYFTGNPVGPVTYGIFRVPLEGGEVEEISTPGGVHSPTFSPDSKWFFDVHHSLDAPPRADLFSVEGGRICTVAKNDLGAYSSPDVVNDIFPVDSDDGTRYWAQLTRPRAFEPGKKYPVVVYVYGGPGAQVVRDHFRTSFQAWRDLLARRGILVFSMDNRGSAGRGREFEIPIHRRLGAIELEDQLAGVGYLKAQPYVDPDRIGIFGWSYGGYMVLKALLETEGVFRAGVSVAPVTDWREYDTAYTERYMQRPEDNPEGYESTSLPERAGELRVPLLLVHGVADDNVHFVNSAIMADAFISEGKIFDAMFYPGKKHGIKGGEWRTHLFSKITRFFEDHL